MNSEENIFAGLPNNKIVLKAIASGPNPPFHHMSIKSKKVLDELSAAKNAGTLKVGPNLVEHPEQDPFHTNPMGNFSDSRHARCRGGYNKRF